MARAGKRYRFREIEFWAERGLIQFVDERFPPEDSRSHDVLTVREFLLNIRSINAALGRIRHAGERIEHEQLVENGIRCAKEAQNQGRPDNPEHVRQILRDRRRAWVLGGGKGKYGTTELHTTSADGTPEGLLLPPMPRHPDQVNTPDQSQIAGPPRRSLIIPDEQGG